MLPGQEIQPFCIDLHKSKYLVELLTVIALTILIEKQFPLPIVDSNTPVPLRNFRNGPTCL